jgi:hypothetical protein
MRIALLGATGKAGGAVLQRLLERGHEVRALVRTPSALGVVHPRLEIVMGGFEDTVALDEAVAGTDAVVTAVGITSRARPTLLVDSVRAIRAAMDRAGVSRLVIVQGVHMAASGDPRNPGLLLIKGVLGITMRPLVQDGHRLKLLLDADPCDWTLLRMPQLTVAPPTGTLLVGRLRVSPLSRVTTGDVAILAVDCLEQRTYLRALPMVASSRAILLGPAELPAEGAVPPPSSTHQDAGRRGAG